MSYESPITIIYGEIQTQIEDGILKAVQDVGLNVNKIELQKALMYDRKQYSQGFEDGKKFAEEERATGHGEWILLDNWGTFKCSICGRGAIRNDYPYCMWCGARMDKETE